jgi:hypothetical protein
MIAIEAGQRNDGMEMKMGSTTLSGYQGIASHGVWKWCGLSGEVDDAVAARRERV